MAKVLHVGRRERMRFGSLLSAVLFGTFKEIQINPNSAIGARIIPLTLQKGLTIYILFYLTGFHTQGKNISRTNLAERFKIGYF